MDSVAAVVVTYNRKYLLSRCLESILGQTQPVGRVYVIDNASTDGTQQHLEERGLLRAGVVEYMSLPANTGSAGGFHKGMQIAYEAGHEWLWLMDDDGHPSPRCLERLMASRSALDVIGPAVVRPDDPGRLTWPLRKVHADGRYKALRSTSHDHAALVRSARDGIYPGFAALFNGVLINRRVPARIGHILAALFIWGDENEYLLRCKSAGFRVGTCVSALHFHPYLKPRLANRWKFYYLYRNTMYMHHRYASLTLPPALRPLYPLYISIRLLFELPSWSPAYVAQLLRGARAALRGELIPFENTVAVAPAPLEPRGATE